jgi:hypothetical protein
MLILTYDYRSAHLPPNKFLDIPGQPLAISALPLGPGLPIISLNHRLPSGAKSRERDGDGNQTDRQGLAQL